jgi:hypothetical protein
MYFQDLKLMHNSSQQSLRLFDGDITRSVTQTFADAVLILGRQLQKERDPGEHNKFKHVSQTELLHIAEGLEGNLGRMAFTVGDSCDMKGLDCVAPSTRAAVQSFVNSDALGDNKIVLCPTRKSKKIRLIRRRTNEFIFPPLFPAKERTHDSEYLLINYLGLQLQLQRQQEDIEGEVILVTERIPCEHCFGVILQFAKKYPRFICNVVYFYETEERDPTSLITPDLPANLCLYKAAMSLRGADVTRITEHTPSHVISSRVLEQAESIDSSAHVSGRAIASVAIPIHRCRK